MKKFRSGLALVLSLTMVASVFAACDNGGKTDTADKVEAEKDKTLSFSYSGLSRSDQSHAAIKGLEKFQDTYHRDVEFIEAGYDEYDQKVMASIAAGDPIDVIKAGTYEYPLFAMKKYTQPISEFVDMESKNVDLPIMKEMFMYKNEYYNAVPKGCSLPLIIFYNKNMFENDGVDDPMDLVSKNEWTFENFKKIAMGFTKDTNNDGAMDQWGLAAWYQWTFFGGATASVCKINDQGQYELNMDNNPALVEALEFIQSAWNKDKWVGLEGSNIYDSFYKQKNAMLNEFTWADKTILEAKENGTFSFDYGVAPFPYGKNNTEQKNLCFSDGFSIMNGSDAPYSAGKLIDCVLDEVVADGEKSNTKLPADHVELYKKLAEKPFNSSYYDSAIDSGKDLCTKVGSGMAISTALESYKSVYQALIDEANKIPEDKIEHDFTTIQVDFSKGIDGFVKASDTVSLGVSQDGDAMKVEMKTAQYNDNCPAVKTDPAKYPIYGYKRYKVTFEYKVEAIPNPEISIYTFSLEREGLTGSPVMLMPDPASVGNFVEGTVYIEPVVDNGKDLYLLLTGGYTDTIWLRNLKIEETTETGEE